jgi:Tol biopolymer transport system component
VFSSNRAGTYHIYTMRADGSDVRRLTRGEDGYTPDWSFK